MTTKTQKRIHILELEIRWIKKWLVRFQNKEDKTKEDIDDLKRNIGRIETSVSRLDQGVYALEEYLKVKGRWEMEDDPCYPPPIHRQREVYKLIKIK